MSIKKLGLTLVAVLALAGITASSAFATAEESNGHWKVSGATLASGESRNVTCTKDSEAGNFKLAGKVLGTAVELEATGVECLESKITQSGNLAQDSGKLKFTGVSVVAPVGCGTSTTITTSALTTQVFMEGTKVYDRFKPTSGETFVTIPITGCAAAGNYPVKGTDFGLAQHKNGAGERVNNLTGEEFTTQTLAFSGAINSTAGGALKLGTEPATLEGAAVNTVEGGLSFGAE
jgi:hypothetical protein